MIKKQWKWTIKVLVLTTVSISLTGCGDDVTFTNSTLDQSTKQGEECSTCSSHTSETSEDTPAPIESPPKDENPNSHNDDGQRNNPDMEEDTDRDNKQFYSCIGRSRNVLFDDIPIDPEPKILNINNEIGIKHIKESVRLSVNGFSGVLKVDRAELVSELHKVHSIARVVARDIHSVTDIRSIMSLNAVSIGSIDGQYGSSGMLGVVSHTIRSLRKHLGLTCISTESLQILENVYGGVRIMGEVGGGSVGKINEVRGIVWVRQMSVGTISNVRGRIVLIDSSVDSLENIDGSVILINSKVGLIKNVSGSLHRR